MIKKLVHLVVLSGLCGFGPISSEASARDSRVVVQQLLQTTQSWDGTRYARYIRGQPQITILRITIPRNTALDWHQHPMISAAYVVSGQIVLEKKATGERKTFHAGQALTETVQTVHRGYTTDQPTELVVFYAGAPGVPLSIKVK
jgi:quercetin dioxygenase-like cupin family protein